MKEEIVTFGRRLNKSKKLGDNALPRGTDDTFLRGMLYFSTGGRNRRIFYHILIEQGTEKRGIEKRECSTKCACCLR
jgi:hypothetical protein